MSRELTVTVSDDVYRGLQNAAGSRTISEVIEDLVQPLVAMDTQLEASYREMSLDADREREAAEWIEGLTEDSNSTLPPYASR